MKRIFATFAPFFLLALGFASCDSSSTYAEQLSDEKKTIKDYISVHHIKVVDTIPSIVPWPDNVYYLTEDGLYLHVIDTGAFVNTNIQKNTVISVRYLETYLDGTANNSNLESSGDPIELFYGSVGTTDSYGDCTAWHEALTYVGDGGRVTMIVPASIGWSLYTEDASLTAMYYELRFNFWK
jgi:hypothetical protein